MDEFDKITPVNPPTVNKKMKPKVQLIGGLKEMLDPFKVASHLKILIPVGMAMIMVIEV